MQISWDVFQILFMTRLLMIESNKPSHGVYELLNKCIYSSINLPININDDKSAARLRGFWHLVQVAVIQRQMR